jgi:pimeloyl-ACP methyl ester carboxylesterase
MLNYRRQEYVMDDDEVRRPPLALTLLESRAIGELCLYAWMYPLLRMCPKGDGHPVLVLPGFLASGRSTAPLRHLLKSVGYQGHRWKLGRNLGPSRVLLEKVMERVHELRHRYNSKVSLIGWSLGGFYARELAWMAPDDVRQVITLGTPFRHYRATAATHLYTTINGHEDEYIDPEIIKRAEQPPPVPCTSIYTRTDGVVPWQCSLDLDSPHTENIRVHGSHSGLGHNPMALWAVMDRLVQPEDEWAPFDQRDHFLWGFPETDHIKVSADS